VYFDLDLVGSSRTDFRNFSGLWKTKPHHRDKVTEHGRDTRDNSPKFFAVIYRDPEVRKASLAILEREDLKVQWVHLEARFAMRYIIIFLVYFLL